MPGDSRAGLLAENERGQEARSLPRVAWSPSEEVRAKLTLVMQWCPCSRAAAGWGIPGREGQGVGLPGGESWGSGGWRDSLGLERSPVSSRWDASPWGRQGPPSLVPGLPGPPAHTLRSVPSRLAGPGAAPRVGQALNGLCVFPLQVAPNC